MKKRGGWLAAAAAGWMATTACSTANGPDPGRAFNEPVFHFNDALDVYLLGPVARGWDWVAPDFVLTGLDNFFYHWGVPRTFLNDLLQVKPVPAGHDFARFAVNTTAGVIGFIDVASMIGIQENEEDLGQTLGWWGTPAGAYMTLPVVPLRCTVRDWIAYPVDSVMNPLGWIHWAVSIGLTLTDTVNARAINDETIEENRREAIDWYVFVRDACLQDREGEVNDGAAPTSEEEENLYDVEE